MLRQVLHEIATSRGALNLSELNRKLGIERSALEGMIQYLVRSGRLVDEEARGDQSGPICPSSGCGSVCAGFANCAFVAKMPKTYSLQPGKVEKVTHRLVENSDQ
jgi:hypothetical protein